MRRDRLACSAMCFVLVCVATTAAAQRPQRPERQRVRVDVRGTVLAIRPGLVQLDSGDLEQGPVLAAIHPKDTKVVVTGTAEPEFLRPGLFIRFETPLDRRGNATEPIRHVTIFTPDGGFSVGVSSDDPASDSGPYLVAGQLRSLKNEAMLIEAGDVQIKADLAEDAKVDVAISDYSLTAEGDAIHVVGWAEVPNQVMAELVEITLAEKLTGPKKKRRPPRTNAPRD